MCWLYNQVLSRFAENTKIIVFTCLISPSLGVIDFNNHKRKLELNLFSVKSYIIWGGSITNKTSEDA